jgi:hypothetical protein
MLLDHPKVILRNWDKEPGINEDLFLAHWQEWYPKARGHFDWVMIPDSDEFLYSPDMLGTLNLAKSVGIQVIKPRGFNLVGDGFPKDDGHSQIYELNPMGVEAPVYAKPVIFQREELRPVRIAQWRQGSGLELLSGLRWCRQGALAEVGRVCQDQSLQRAISMKCDKCGKTDFSTDGMPWYHVSYNNSIQAFCSRRCLVEFIAPELNKAVVVNQWVPTEVELRRMSGEDA